ncbi:UNVERIFIED_CONTAM: zinc finger homeobox protein 3 [Trichonephila clavipes]
MLKQALLERSANAENGNTEVTQHTCPFCNYTSSNEVHMQMHVVSQHSQKPSTLACPLCQDGFREWGVLENHLIDTHHVNKEGVKRLLALVDKTEWMAEMETSKQNDKQPIKSEIIKTETSESFPHQKQLANGPSTATDLSMTANANNDDDEPMEVKQEILELDCRSDSSDGKEDDDYTCASCGRMFVQVEDLFCHQNEMGHLEYKNTPKGNGFFCWKKGCGMYFATMTTAQFHFKEKHALKFNVPVSEKHVYKFRCTQCSLAFKTSDKLKLHMQYHLIRAATQCVLCGKSFRTVLALQKHVEMSHADMTKEQLEQYRASLMSNPLLTGNGSSASGGVLDPQTTELLKKETNREDFDDDNPDETISLPDDSDNIEEIVEDGNENKEQQVLEDYINSQAIAEDSYTDPNRKYKCHRCKVAFTRQSYLTSHNKTLLHRKGEKMSYPMEKYLDPNRPFKCEVCKESFTQKNILLVHYNSVSHLHKLKLSMKENNTPNSTVSAPVSSTSVGSPASPTVVTTTNSIASTVSPTNLTTQTSNSAESEKKPYKCNLCKLSYSQASTLDIHVRSVLHQSKASRIQELVLSGEFDFSAPLVERPDSGPSAEQPPAKTENGNTTLDNSQNNLPPSTSQPLKVPEAPTSQAATTSSSIITPVTSSPQFTFPLHPDHNNIMQQTLNLMQPSMMSGQTPPFQCSRCGSMCSSQEALIQHQQLYCFFAQAPLPPLLNAAPTSTQPPLMPLSQIQQRQQADREEVPEKQTRITCGISESSPSPAMQINHTNTRSPTPGQQMFKNRFPFLRPKPLIFRHLLESFGFDVVMQFNENSQKRHKKEKENEKKEEQKENSSENKDSNEKDGQKKLDLPEINRSTCSKCGKGFSSIWVLKAHQEEMHKDIVPIQNVEKFAEDFREDYERRNASIPVIDDANNMAEAPSPSSSGELSAGPSSTPATPSGATPLSVPNAVTPPVTSLGSQMPDMASSVTANHMAQMQFNQLLMSMGLSMGLPMPMNMGMNMNLPFAAAMNMHPPLIPLMMPPPLDPLMASAFGHPMMPGAAVDPNFFAAQQKMLQQQQLSQQQKRARTRINDDQLKILRAYFDINNSPTEDQLLEMSDKSGLPLKVIKHWFRNTLFKERQRNKDSPYNFNNPPSTYLNLEEYEKTGEAKITPLVSTDKQDDQKNSESTVPEKKESIPPPQTEVEKNEDFCDLSSKDIKLEKYSTNDCQKSEPPLQSKRHENNISFTSCMTSSAQEMLAMSDAINCSVSGGPATSNALLSMDLRTSLADRFAANYSNNPFSSAASSMMSFMPPGSVSPPTSESPHSTGTPSGTPTPSCSSSGKRANRTRFTDYQIKVLQEFFETNAYPKDDDLEYLSKLLNLSPRVIVVWFQNARQKARKVYENQPPITTEDENAGRFQRTPGLNYQCKKCLQVFQRYYELIKHQKSSCFKDENPLAGQIKVMSGDERSSQPATPTLPTPNIPVGPRPAEKLSSSTNNQNGTYRCDKCSLAFSRFDLWREHQLVHMMNPTLFPSYQPSSFPVLQYDSASNPNSLQLSQMKRKLSDDEESQSEHPRDKRLRTTILPEQLDYLYQQYQLESNPSRKMLENIAREVGLKKRVVQVWFQNTRARERKGQFRAHQQVIHKRCPFCRALFKARSALESHLATRHADQYTKGDINIDALPDGEGDSEDPESPGEDKVSNSAASPSQSFPTNPTELNNQMKRYYEDSLKKYFDELVSAKENNKDTSAIADLSLGKSVDKGLSDSPIKESPLDLSKPLKALMEKSNGGLVEKFNLEDGTSRGGLMDDARSETYSESTDNMDGEESNPTSPSSRYSSSSNKRFRTQMTTIQLKVMKSIFVDYKTPSMCECESLGKEIGLPKRVVQVWFQNARAKEKKARLAFVKTFGHEMEPPKVSEECTLCNVKYNIKYSPSTLQEHIFSKKHIENLKTHIDSLKKLTDGHDSDTAPSFDSAMTPNHVSNCSNASSLSVTNSTPKQAVSTSMSGLTGGLSSFANNPDRTKSEPTFDSPVSQRKESMANGESGASSGKDKQDDKEDSFLPTQNSSQENHNLNDFAPPSTSAETSSTPSSAAGLFPYMYSPFPGYYSGMPGAFIHHAMYPGRTKL